MDIVVFQHHIVAGSNIVFRIFVNKFNVIAAIRICNYAAYCRFARQRFFYGQIFFGSGLRFFRTDVRINVCVRIGIPHFHVLCGKPVQLDLIRGDGSGVLAGFGVADSSSLDSRFFFCIGVACLSGGIARYCAFPLRAGAFFAARLRTAGKASDCQCRS